MVNNNSVTVVGTVDFDGLVSGPGDFFGPGTANFNGGMAPGASPAEVQFEGDVALAASNTLFIEIAGTTLGADYDSLSIAGSADLDGLLSVSLDWLHTHHRPAVHGSHGRAASQTTASRSRVRQPARSASWSAAPA